MRRLLLGIGILLSAICLPMAVFFGATVVRVALAPEACIRCGPAWAADPGGQLLQTIPAELALLVIPALTLWGWLALRKGARSEEAARDRWTAARLGVALLAAGMIAVGLYRGLEALLTGTFEAPRGVVSLAGSPLGFSFEVGLWLVFMPLGGVFWLWVAHLLRPGSASRAAMEQRQAERKRLQAEAKERWSGSR